MPTDWMWGTGSIKDEVPSLERTETRGGGVVGVVELANNLAEIRKTEVITMMIHSKVPLGGYSGPALVTNSGRLGQ
jgi:hypothetical protein